MPALPLQRATRTVRHINRYRQILGVLLKYGFEDVVTRFGIHDLLEYGRQLVSSNRNPRTTQTTPARLRHAIEELGPTFIKLGQIFSTRPDLIPEEFVAELENLQQSVPPFPFEKVRAIVERELGRPLNEAFPTFSEISIAAASIGQVHRATLPDGTDVVVKVQRPGIRETIEVDLEILEDLAATVEKHVPDWQIQQPSRLVDEFRDIIRRELDYTTEAMHLERFSEQFARDDTIRTPRLYRAFSTTRVLTMEFLELTSIRDAAALRVAGYDPALIAQRGAELTLKQVFEFGFFHADPHPGNVFALPGNVICLLDFGMVGRLSRQARFEFADLVHALAQRDADRVTRTLLRLTTPLDDNALEPKELERDVTVFIDTHFVHALADLHFQKLLRELMQLLNRHRLRLDTSLVTMLKAIATIEKIASGLDPNLDMVALARPYVRRAKMERLRPRRALRALLDSAGDLVELTRDLPGNLRYFITSVRRGGINIGFEHHGLQPMLESNERIANRVSFAIVVASLIVGSSLIVHSRLPPLWNDVPIIGIIGYLVAGVMGFILLIAILRHGRL
ncbi:MAG: ABC1 kinase family protein [Phycisphaerae bacterium]